MSVNKKHCVPPINEAQIDSICVDLKRMKLTKQNLDRKQIKDKSQILMEQSITPCEVSTGTESVVSKNKKSKFKSSRDHFKGLDEKKKSYQQHRMHMKQSQIATYKVSSENVVPKNNESKLKSSRNNVRGQAMNDNSYEQSVIPRKQSNISTSKVCIENDVSKNNKSKFKSAKNNFRRWDDKKNTNRNRQNINLCNFEDLLDCLIMLLNNQNAANLIKVKSMFNCEINLKEDRAPVADIVNIINKIASSDSKFKSEVLHLMFVQQFLKALQLYILQSAKECSQTEDNRKVCESFFHNLIKLSGFSIELLPCKYLLMLKPALILSKSILERLKNNGINIDVEYSVFNDMCLLIDTRKDKIKEENVPDEEISVMKLRSVFPTKDDLFGKAPELRKNIIEGAYTNVDHYLTVQFNLLHEDFVSPLRTGIAEYLSPTSHTGKKSGIAIYHNVNILRASVDSGKLGHVIKLERKLKWSMVSSYFIYGSLILFTPNNFETFFLGTVIKVNNKNETIIVKLDESHYDVCDNIYAQGFLMAASKVFFEPYLHVLSALQNIDKETFPMEKYIVQVNPEPKCPAYIKDLNKTTYNIFDTRNVNIMDSTWPELCSVTFNISQQKAFQAALTSEFVAIQGPPGTGKTFLGLQIATTLIDNVNIGTPILVVCYKNHALDQFLEGILKKTKKIVRIGGRSKNEILEKYNLKNIRRKSCADYNYPAYEEVLCSLVTCYREKQNRIDGLKVTGIVSTESILSFIPYANIRTEIMRSRIEEWLMEGVYMDEEDLFYESNDTHFLDQNMENCGLVSYLNEGVEIGNCDNENLDYSLSMNDHLEENTKRLEQLYIDDHANVYSQISEEQPCDDYSSKRTPEFSVTIADLEKQCNIYKSMIQQLLFGFPHVTTDEYTLSEEEIQFRIYVWKNYIVDLGARISFLKRLVPRKFNASSEQLDKLYKISQSSIWSLTTQQRWMLYDSWLTDLAKHIKQEMIQLEKTIRLEEQELDDARSRVDLSILEKADVVGVTTTGAAKLRTMLNKLGAKIVVIEEAAEVLESHIVTALSSSCQHVILIGDHKQLRPSPAVHELCTRFKLDVSLFERMVRNGLNCYQLSVQHRMRPEFSSLIVPDIYPELTNHASTEHRPNILGVHSNLYFINHNHLEENLVHSTTHVNKHEAEFVVAFARHLLLQGYKEEDITILATYAGQVRQVNKVKQQILPVYRDLRISTVDDFQGEESKIIILSLVRSNSENKIGFLKTENRVCVALSRSRDGFFIIGNMDMLSENAAIWKKVKNKLTQHNALGNSLNLRCQNHPDTVLAINDVKMFRSVPEGGCQRMCATVLTCGHVCKYHCHPLDQAHEDKYICSYPCERILCERNHGCPKTCGVKCGPCRVPVQHTLACGHEETAACSSQPGTLQCHTELPCVLPHCGHEALRWCCETEKQAFLRQGCHLVCDKSLPCGHTCQEICHNSGVFSKIEVLNTWTTCICKIPVEITLPCEHNIKTNCNQIYPEINKERFISKTKCTKMVDKTMPCGHILTVQCSKSADVHCTVQIKRTLNCGHEQSEFCSTTLKSLCQQPCSRTLPCGHACKQMCVDLCKCTEYVKKDMSCGHEMQALCGSSDLSCDKPCERVRACGHTCQGRCGSPCDSTPCPQIIQYSAPSACGHEPVMAPCHLAQVKDVSAEVLAKHCQATCNTLLKCGHTCPGCCNTCKLQGLHAECDQPCSRILLCGHRCVVQCNEECAPCYEKCLNVCSHSKCDGCCGEPCSPCKEPCNIGCIHMKCTRPCFFICNRWPCNQPCPETLACGHPCAGFCGELCPPLCPLCDPQSSAGDLTSRLVVLEDCGHTVEAKILDPTFNSNPPYIVNCPLESCGKPIVSTKRYRNYVKRTLSNLMRRKKDIEAMNHFKTHDPSEQRKYPDIHQPTKMYHERYGRAPWLHNDGYGQRRSYRSN